MAIKGQRIDETGNVYGEITVISRAESSGAYNSMWNVRCSCGKEWVLNRNKLKMGQIACYECTAKINGLKRRGNYKGNTYNSLTCIEELDEWTENKQPRQLAMFQCVCGNVVKAALHSVVGGSKKSCGCKKLDYLDRVSSATRLTTRTRHESKIGSVVGSYTAVSLFYKNEYFYVCRCVCGREKPIAVNRFLLGKFPPCVECEKISKEKRLVDSMIGMRFGNRVIVSEAPHKNGIRMWNCVCDCGYESAVYENSLKSGTSNQCLSCGCKDAGLKNIKDLTGKKFGMLTTIEIAGKTKSGNYKWFCVCDCGGTKVVSSYGLSSGGTSSCGCMLSSAEMRIARELRKRNIKFVREKTFAGCKHKCPLRFDFYLPTYGWCIEYDGQQHFEPVDFFGGVEAFNERQMLDKIKADYCKEHFIPLIRIPYTESERLEEIVDSISSFLNKKSLRQKINVKAGVQNIRDS